MSEAGVEIDEEDEEDICGGECDTGRHCGPASR